MIIPSPMMHDSASQIWFVDFGALDNLAASLIWRDGVGVTVQN